MDGLCDHLLKTIADMATASNTITFAVYHIENYEASNYTIYDGNEEALCMFYATRNMLDPEWRLKVVQQLREERRVQAGWKPPILTRTKAAFEAVVRSTMNNYIYRFDDDGVDTMVIMWMCMQGRTEPPLAVAPGNGVMMQQFQTSVFDMERVYIRGDNEAKQVLVKFVMDAAEALLATA